jgi:hypothetical protein
MNDDTRRFLDEIAKNLALDIVSQLHPYLSSSSSSCKFTSTTGVPKFAKLLNGTLLTSVRG